MTAIEPTKEYTQAVSRIRDLLGRWLESGVDLFVTLHEIEAGGVWRTLHPTFADFLTREFPNALGLNRYENVMRAIDVYGIERVKLVGVEGCHAMLSAPLLADQAKRDELEASIDQHINATGTPPPAQELRKMVRGILSEPSPLARSTTAVRKESALVQENATLRAELKAANKRIGELERQVKKLETQAKAGVRGGARAEPVRQEKRAG